MLGVQVTSSSDKQKMDFFFFSPQKTNFVNLYTHKHISEHTTKKKENTFTRCQKPISI